MPVFIVKKLLYAKKTIEYQTLFRKTAARGWQPPSFQAAYIRVRQERQKMDSLPGNEFLAITPDGCRFLAMKTLTVEEATPGLGRLVELALAGEQIQIRKGSGVVELRPARSNQTTDEQELSPREALRRLQETGRLTAQQAEGYLREVHEERLASQSRPPA
jgi:hypothetical protein